MKRARSGRAGFTHAHAVAATLIICAIPLLAGLHRAPANTANMETILFQTSVETWRADTSVLLPTYLGSPRVRKPPLPVWLNAAAWIDMDRGHASDQALLLRARLVSVGLGLVMLLALGWLGASLISRTAGVVAMAAAGTFPLFQAEARLCSYDIHFAAWLTLAIAVAAAAALTDQPPRRARLTAALSGVALGLAIMSKGPLALPLFLMALIPITALAGRARRALLTTAWAFVVAALVAMPWYAWLLISRPHVMDLLAQEYTGSLSAEHAWWFYPSRALPGVAPWTLWFLAGIVAPLVLRRLRHEPAWIVSWLWLIGGLVIFTLAPGKAARYLLPLTPAVALLIAAAIGELGAADRWRRAWRSLGVVHLLGLAAGAVGLPLLLTGAIPASPSSTYADYVALSWPWALGLGLVLTSVTGWGLYLRAWRSPAHCATVTLLWAAAASSTLWAIARPPNLEPDAPAPVAVRSGDDRRLAAGPALHRSVVANRTADPEPSGSAQCPEHRTARGDARQAG